MKNKITLKSRFGIIANVTFNIIHETKEGDFLISYNSAKKAKRHNSGDYYSGLEIYESRHIGGGEPFALINIKTADIVNLINKG